VNKVQVGGKKDSRSRSLTALIKPNIYHQHITNTQTNVSHHNTSHLSQGRLKNSEVKPSKYCAKVTSYSADSQLTLADCSNREYKSEQQAILTHLIPRDLRPRESRDVTLQPDGGSLEHLG